MIAQSKLLVPSALAKIRKTLGYDEGCLPLCPVSVGRLNRSTQHRR